MDGAAESLLIAVILTPVFFFFSLSLALSPALPRPTASRLTNFPSTPIAEENRQRGV